MPTHNSLVLFTCTNELLLCLRTTPMYCLPVQMNYFYAYAQLFCTVYLYKCTAPTPTHNSLVLFTCTNALLLRLRTTPLYCLPVQMNYSYAYAQLPCTVYLYKCTAPTPTHNSLVLFTCTNELLLCLRTTPLYCLPVLMNCSYAYAQLPCTVYLYK
jgi:hypothetical protein